MGGQRSEQPVSPGSVGPADVEQSDLLAVRVDGDRPTERDGHQLVAETDPEDGEVGIAALAHQLLDGSEPRVLVVVVGAHRTTQHQQPVVRRQRGELVPGVRAAHVEVAAGLAQPVADQRGRALAVVLDDQHRRARAHAVSRSGV